MPYKEIEGNLIVLAKQGMFDVIAHGCNCFCTMKSGIAPQMAAAFGCDRFSLEGVNHKGDINKLGGIDFECLYEVQYAGKTAWLKTPGTASTTGSRLFIINAYTQYSFNAKEKPFDYEASTLCMRKIAHKFPQMKIGLPKIGSGLAGGDWDIIKKIIQRELANMDVTIVIYKP
jgi:O-acetyl-ADP-ribose deacetylase (regulator of RNase III)